MLLCALHEATILEVAEEVRSRGEFRLRLKDIHAGSTLKKAMLYFDAVLSFPLIAAASDSQRLERLYGLRNAVAHGFGHVSTINADRWREIERWATSNSGISLDGGYIRLSEEFLRDAFEFVRQSLVDLITRAEDYGRTSDART